MWRLRLFSTQVERAILFLLLLLLQEKDEEQQRRHVYSPCELGHERMSVHTHGVTRQHRTERRITRTTWTRVVCTLQHKHEHYFLQLITYIVEPCCYWYACKTCTPESRYLRKGSRTHTYLHNCGRILFQRLGKPYFSFIINTGSFCPYWSDSLYCYRFHCTVSSKSPPDKHFVTSAGTRTYSNTGIWIILTSINPMWFCWLFLELALYIESINNNKV